MPETKMIHNMKKILLTLAALSFICLGCMSSAKAQEREWAGFNRYSKSNADIIAAQKAGAKKPVAVLMGDSITDAWPNDDPSFFSDNNLIGRGIGGQTSSEMLVRFRKDVIDLHPKYVLILAGTNDMAQNNGPISIEDTYGNIVSMCELAKLHKIKPVVCSVIPASNFPWRKHLGDRSNDIITLNNMLKAYAAKNNFKYIDYHSALKDEGNGLQAALGKDAVHPNLFGYQIMEKLVLETLRIKKK